MRWYIFCLPIALVLQCSACSDPCADADAWLVNSGVCLIDSRNEERIDAERLDRDFMRIEELVRAWTGKNTDNRATIDSLKYSIKFGDEGDNYPSGRSPANTQFTCLPLSDSECWEAQTYIRGSIKSEGELHFNLVHEYLHILLFGQLGRTTQEHPAPYFRESQCSLAWDIMLQFWTYTSPGTSIENASYNWARWYPEGKEPDCSEYEP